MTFNIFHEGLLVECIDSVMHCVNFKPLMLKEGNVPKVLIIKSIFRRN